MDFKIRASRRPCNEEFMRGIKLALILTQFESLFHKFTTTNLSLPFLRIALRISDRQLHVGIFYKSGRTVAINRIFATPILFRHGPNPKFILFRHKQKPDIALLRHESSTRREIQTKFGLVWLRIDQVQRYNLPRRIQSKPLCRSNPVGRNIATVYLLSLRLKIGFFAVL